MKTYKTQVMIWSNIGNNPITKRTGAFCDELVNMFIECTDPNDALNQVLKIKQNTPHAYSCWFNIIDYPNQNTKSAFCHYGRN